MRGDVTLWGLAFLWGVVLGLFYFGGLWMTLKTMPGKKWPKRRLAISYLVRVAGVLAGFWIVVQKGGVALLFTVVAFFGVRIILTRVLGPKNGEKDHAAQS